MLDSKQLSQPEGKAVQSNGFDIDIFTYDVQQILNQRFNELLITIQRDKFDASQLLEQSSLFYNFLSEKYTSYQLKNKIEEELNTKNIKQIINNLMLINVKKNNIVMRLDDDTYKKLLNIQSQIDMKSYLLHSAKKSNSTPTPTHADNYEYFVMGLNQFDGSAVDKQVFKKIAHKIYLADYLLSRCIEKLNSNINKASFYQVSNKEIDYTAIETFINKQEKLELKIPDQNISLTEDELKYCDEKFFLEWALNLMAAVTKYFIKYGIAENSKHTHQCIAHKVMSMLKEILTNNDSQVIIKFENTVNRLNDLPLKKGKLKKIINHALNEVSSINQITKSDDKFDALVKQNVALKDADKKKLIESRFDEMRYDRILQKRQKFVNSIYGKQSHESTKNSEEFSLNSISLNDYISLMKNNLNIIQRFLNLFKKDFHIADVKKIIVKKSLFSSSEKSRKTKDKTKSNGYPLSLAIDK
ncbi:MAG: hypothetical protein CMF49_04510 [Legionellales bacterium]|nr:hypothetical protein [Legionellales bacterium]